VLYSGGYKYFGLHLEDAQVLKTCYKKSNGWLANQCLTASWHLANVNFLRV